jgi:hypothetical protein
MTFPLNYVVRIFNTVRFSLFDKFGALNSAPVFAAFARGLDRHGIARCHHDINADVAVIWSVVWSGRMQGNRTIWQHYRDHGRPVVVLEVGMLDRGRTWKIGVNGTGLQSQFCRHLDADRPGHIGIHTQPWKTPGSDIVICLQREDSEQWQGLPPVQTWLDRVVDHIKSVSDRPIQIRPHPRRPAYCAPGTTLTRPQRVHGTYDSYDFDRALDQAWCVVNWNSGPACQAVLKGVPVFTGPDSLAAPMGLQDWNLIESPLRTDRSQWLIDLAHTEWTLDEIASGTMLDQLLIRIQSL